MLEPDYTAAISYALETLKAGLSPNLFYHNLWHTQDDVMPSAVQLARLSDVPEEEVLLLKVAAAYHDTGFLQVYDNHEQVGAAWAAAVLPGYGFSVEQIGRITDMILATRYPQEPGNLLEQILADADLDVLGRSDFFERNAALHREVEIYKRPFSPHDWLSSQIKFLKQHHYFTPAAIQLRQLNKEKHIAQLEVKLHQINLQL